MEKKTILTGLKPTGDLTLGNYLGSIKQMAKMQDEYNSYIFVADLHALTVYQDPKELNERIRKFIAMYIACGIDPDKNVIYIQSENEFIPAMSFILECNTYYGEASRMIQFKEKSKENANFSVGLLTYPILMAIDILYCDADLVPVGIDQKQHVELARDIAMRFNKKYSDIFKIPEPLVNDASAKIYDLKNPLKKMSKSEIDPSGVISLFDDPKVAGKKIMKATTDSIGKINYDIKNQPGISNLLNIASLLDNKSIEEIVLEYQDKGYGDFKKYVASVVENFLVNIQGKYNELLTSGKINEILDKGKEISRNLAKNKYEQMKKCVGTVREKI